MVSKIEGGILLRRQTLLWLIAVLGSIRAILEHTTLVDLTLMSTHPTPSRVRTYQTGRSAILGVVLAGV